MRKRRCISAFLAAPSMMRSTGQIEPPRLIKGRKLWDIRDLDMTFDALPRENDILPGTSWHDD